MKIRYPIIGAIIILIVFVGFDRYIEPEIASILGILFLVCLALIAYLILRNIFRAVKGAITGTPAGDFRGEARNACEKVTPKRKQEKTPPWEK